MSQYSGEGESYSQSSSEPSVQPPNLFINSQEPKVHKVTPILKPKTVTRKPLNIALDKGQAFTAIKYQKCQKQGLHQNQLLNLVCLEKQCIENSSICGVCMEEEHKSHHVRPLKLVVGYSQKKKKKLESFKNISPALQTIIPEMEKEQLQKLDQLQKSILPVFETAKDIMIGCNSRTQSQLETQKGQQSLIQCISSLEHQQIDAQSFITLVRKLHQGIPTQTTGYHNLTSEEEQIKYVQTGNATMQDHFKSTIAITLKTLEQHHDFLTKMLNSKLIGKEVIYEFDSKLKHPSVSILTPTSAKSTVGGDYYFALLAPALGESKKKVERFAFKITQNTSNWMGVGICHQQTVRKNEYKFKYSTIQHGGYLISSNGGSWSSLSAQDNNSVKAFRFKTGDIIFVIVDFDTKTITFEKKKKSKASLTESYVLDFQQKENDPLHLCVLFYYANNEIGFLGKAEDNGIDDGTDNLPDKEPGDPGYYSYDDPSLEWEE